MEAHRIHTAYRALLKASKGSVAREEVPLIRKALNLAIRACGDNVILTGEPEILHSLSVATIIAGEMGLGQTSIITALLHDSYSRVGLTPQELEKTFNKEVPEIQIGRAHV